MKDLQFHSGRIRLMEILSLKMPFIVYLGLDQNNKQKIIKTIGAPYKESVYQEVFRTYSSNDLITSAWYGHNQSDLQNIDNEFLFNTYVEYYRKCSREYNISNCQAEVDEQGKLYLIYDYIEGSELQDVYLQSKNFNFLSLIPSLLQALSQYPHGDLSFYNIILHQNKKQFSIIDPSIIYQNHFFTNTEYYPIVPPLFYIPSEDYVTYADQLAIGIMFYKTLTGFNPLSQYMYHPYWAKEFGSDSFGLYSNIEKAYSHFITVLPTWQKNEQFDFLFYRKITQEILSQKESITDHRYHEFPLDFYRIIPPHHVNPAISERISSICMDLIYSYKPIASYIKQINSVL
jgi:hypothetical protein